MQRREGKPEPRGFMKSAYFEALRALRREQPEKYIAMSPSIKAHVEVYCLLRRAAQNRRERIAA